MAATPAAQSEEVEPMYGSSLIDGYDFRKDVGPKGSIFYVKTQNRFRGKYVGLKMPAGRRAIFAWAYDTVNQRALYLGAVGWLWAKKILIKDFNFSGN